MSAVLDQFSDPEADSLALLRQLFDVMRPGRDESAEAGVARFEDLIDRLREDPVLARAFRQHFVSVFTTRRLTSFFTDSGILPATGFFTEWSRIISHKFLPEIPDERDLRECIHVFLASPDDWIWLEEIPQGDWTRFWQLQAPADEMDAAAWRQLVCEMLDAIRLLAHRVSGLGMDSTLLRASTSLENYTPSFLELPSEAQNYYKSLQRHFAAPNEPADDGQHLLVLVDQCLDGLQRARRHLLSVGTSLHLTYALTRCQQSLERLAQLVLMMQTFLKSSQIVEAIVDQPGADAPKASGGQIASYQALRAWSDFVRQALITENRRNNFSDYWQRLSELLSVRIAENAAQSGEHYLCKTHRDYRRMWVSAMGAGVFIGIMALLKIFAESIDASLFMSAVMRSLIYGLGFTLIYLVGFTVATKQPAMTAQTLVSSLSGADTGRQDDLSEVVDLIAAVSRSQTAAICGNILIAFPVAIALGTGMGHFTEGPVISAGKTASLLNDLDVFGWAIPHAALAGVFLYLAGLISGYFDNRAAHNQTGLRIGRLPWLQELLGQDRAMRFGDYVGRHLGGIMGNFLFGVMLGSAGIVGVILGLPIDIRHIAFSSANLGYVIVGSTAMPDVEVLAWAVFGVFCIGFTNLAVSFTLALRTAFKARRMSFGGYKKLLRALLERLRTDPRSFIWPSTDRSSS